MLNNVKTSVLMVINPITSSNLYYQKQKSEITGFGSTNSQSVSSQVNNQTIKLQADSQINLGTINGKEFDMKINPTGGYQWTGAIQVKYTPDSRVSQESVIAAYAAQQYTREEYNECAQITGVINQLYLIVDRGWTAERFNDFCDQTKILQTDVESALSRLGLDYSQPFNINGRTFVYESGTLKDFKEQ